MSARAEVDFNSRDEFGNIPVDPADVQGLASVGEWIDLFDDEGNRCFGLVVKVGEDMSVAPEWRTFASPTDSRVIVDASAYWQKIEWISGLSVNLRVHPEPPQNNWGARPMSSAQ